MTFVYDNHKILWKVIHKTERTCPGCSSVKVSRIVLYSRAMANLSNHFQIISNPFLYTLGFQIFPYRLKKFNLLTQINFYFSYCPIYTFFCCNKNISRIYLIIIEKSNSMSTHRIYTLNGFYFFTPENNS